jgi:hypothetical protein
MHGVQIMAQPPRKSTDTTTSSGPKRPYDLGLEWPAPESPKQNKNLTALDNAKKAIEEIVIPFCKGARSHIHFIFQITIGEDQKPNRLYFGSHERTAEISVESDCVELKQTNVDVQNITDKLNVNDQESTINFIKEVIERLTEDST